MTRRRIELASFAAALLAAWLLPQPIEAVQCTVEVDGIDQTLTVPAKGDASCPQWPVLHPGDSVVVKVVRANLIHYRYEVKTTKEESLAASYGVVGVGELLDNVSESFRGAVATPGTPITAMKNPDAATLEQQLKQARADASSAKAEATALIDAFKSVEHRVSEPWKKSDKETWPTEYNAAANAFFNGYDTVRQKLSQAWSVAQAGHDAVTVLQALEENDQLDRFEGGFGGIITEVKEALGALDQTALRVRRWQDLLKRDPVLKQTFLVDRRSKRYTVAVFREPLTDAAKAIEAGGGAGDKADTEDEDETAAEKDAFASFSYEGHALYRFNVSLGAAALYRPDAKTFSIGSQIGSDNAVSYRVREGTSSEYGVQPVAMIGTYLRPVDNYDSNRGPAWMVTVGTEISGSPSTYMLGLACDFNPGFGIAFGVTRYEKTVLADGWEPGQLVPTDDEGAPVIDAVPTRKDDGIGFYTALVFRPSIFGAFWRARTES